MHKSLKIGMTAGALGALVALGGLAPAQAAEDVAKLSVLHGVPGLTVDVYVNDKLTLDDFKPGDLAGPLDLPAGTYKVAITASDAADASAPAIGPVDLPLEAGKNYTAAAHLDEAGKPTATLFTNDISQLAAGDGRLTVRHVAAAPAVDVLANGAAAITALVNPKESVLTLPAGTISAAVAATGTTDPVIGPADVNVAEGTNTIVYAWGSLTDKNLALAVQTIDGLHSNPDSIPAGEAGLVATNQADGSTGLMVGGFAAVLMGLIAAGVVGVRRLSAVRR
ncbi:MULTISPECIES: DUF4397 domain-containing protein [Cryobacterium]|uniref:DUF4397 domain-containing protein n=1 Tax=Cryobacterium breve TaxID=1259258 RepID=A0ABY2J4G6_9MICO|nr:MULTISPECIES: DUF4397 domain-containing protein [Cryobacterium]TFC92092.1 DUF4397 domain-containing protein [Cryobacterium sp. TmT3-12]TFC99769.1 DUF4397 domain-containing protein [Cryobacterium breve]